MSLVIDGAPRTMRLTLGALAELEAELGESSLVALVERFEQGRFSTADVLALLRAGLRGGDRDYDCSPLADAEIEGGIVAAAQAAAQLLTRAFSVQER